MKNYELRKSQKSVLINWLVNPLSTQYNLAGLHRFPLVYSFEHLKQAIISVCEKHPQLYMRYAKFEAVETES